MSFYLVLVFISHVEIIAVPDRLVCEQLRAIVVQESARGALIGAKCEGFVSSVAPPVKK